MRNVIFLLMAIFLFACQTQQKEKSAEDKKETSDIDTAKASESIRTNMSFLNDFNALEEVFGNENWLIAGKKDSSYFYFSRLGNYKVNTYVYKLVKGDSAKVIYGSMLPEGNSLTWNFDNHKVYITRATRGLAVWSVIGADSVQYEFLRLNDNQIRLTYPDKKKVVLQKTLAFSLFLVRNRYDYAHGTKYAFDSTQFNKKK